MEFSIKLIVLFTVAFSLILGLYGLLKQTKKDLKAAVVLINELTREKDKVKSRLDDLFGPVWGSKNHNFKELLQRLDEFDLKKETSNEELSLLKHKVDFALEMFLRCEYMFNNPAKYSKGQILKKKWLITGAEITGSIMASIEIDTKGAVFSLQKGNFREWHVYLKWEYTATDVSSGDVVKFYDIKELV